MGHDIEASWAALEISRMLKSNPSFCFSTPPASSSLSVFPSGQGKRTWPIPDGIIQVENGNDAYKIALEFKRPNESVHGILTAMGQSLAYVKKGFSATVIVIPKSYDTLSDAGKYVKEVLDYSSTDKPIGVFVYEEANSSVPSPFENKISCERTLSLENSSSSPVSSSQKTETQWAHLREGSSTPSAFYRYLWIAKKLDEKTHRISFNNQNLSAAAVRNGESDVLKYLSNSNNISFHDKVWRYFWFTYVLTPAVASIWKIPHRGNYEVNDTATLLEQSDGLSQMKFFSGKSNSIKEKLVLKLNSKSITENQAWEEFAKNIRKRAHSYREDIDSGLSHIGMLEDDGRPTDLGYRFIDASERNKHNPHTGTAKSILGSAILENGKLNAFLHYVYRVSEKKFELNPLEFAQSTNKKKIDVDKYKKWLENELIQLNVMRKVSTRGGQERKPFQAELAILRQFNYIKKFRVGVGLEINWPKVQESTDLSM